MIMADLNGSMVLYATHFNFGSVQSHLAFNYMIFQNFIYLLFKYLQLSYPHSLQCREFQSVTSLCEKIRGIHGDLNADLSYS